jgi:hypothetical protein
LGRIFVDIKRLFGASLGRTFYFLGIIMKEEERQAWESEMKHTDMFISRVNNKFESSYVFAEQVVRYLRKNHSLAAKIQSSQLYSFMRNYAVRHIMLSDKRYSGKDYLDVLRDFEAFADIQNKYSNIKPLELTKDEMERIIKYWETGSFSYTTYSMIVDEDE